MMSNNVCVPSRAEPYPKKSDYRNESLTFHSRLMLEVRIFRNDPKVEIDFESGEYGPPGAKSKELP